MKTKVICHRETGNLYLLHLRSTFSNWSIDPVCPSFDYVKDNYFEIETEIESFPVITKAINVNFDNFIVLGDL